MKGPSAPKVRASACNLQVTSDWSTLQGTVTALEEKLEEKTTALEEHAKQLAEAKHLLGTQAVQLSELQETVSSLVSKAPRGSGR